MNRLILVAILLGKLEVTSYRAVREQTDSTPFNTSTTERVRAGGCAISRDLLCGACRKLHHRCARPDNPTKLHYGDWLYIRGFGYRQINDVMADCATVRRRGRVVARFPIRRHVDIFVERWAEEHAVGVQQCYVYSVKEHYEN